MLTKHTEKKTVLILKKTKHAKTIYEQTRGLMFLKHKNFDFALIFHFKSKSRFLNSIHMFFVFFPILAIFLDENKIVVDKKILKPFYPFYTPKRPCKYLIELPQKYNNKIAIGNKLNWSK